LRRKLPWTKILAQFIPGKTGVNNKKRFKNILYITNLLITVGWYGLDASD
jgi:hypothetical protein